MSDKKPNFTNLFHKDHGLSDGHIEFLMGNEEIASKDDGEFILIVLPLPDHLPDLKCALYGPSVGDEPGSIPLEKTYRQVRGNRMGASSMVSLPARPARKMVVVGVKGGMCFTAYGTRADSPSPIETCEAREKYWEGAITKEEYDESFSFWRSHWLSDEEH